MATIDALTAAYTNLLLRPVAGPGVCERCFNLIDGYRLCYSCAHIEPWLALVAPISYSIGHEQLHHVLAGYKRWPLAVAEQPRRELAAVLWRHLEAHESCHAAAAGVDRFDLVTTVPGGTGEADAAQPLRELVSQLVLPVRGRYARLLVRSGRPPDPRRFDPDRFTATRLMGGESVLLLDDMWTTGASAQSAAAVLRAAGAGTVAAVVIGRHVHRDWGANDRHLRMLEHPYNWERCVNCSPVPAARTPSPHPASAG